MADLTAQLQEQITAAIADKQPLSIIGGNSKHFFGRHVQANPLNVADHTGITSYEPTELVMTARAGTGLEEIEQVLAENGQMLAFEPPRFGPMATIGGTVACNLSGPRRAYTGAVRDYVLGTRIINGKADVLHFGGEVMKNVAGYDVSRLMVGAMGTLGALLEVSFKVLPRAASEITLVREASEADAIERANQWAGTPLPLSATAWIDGKLYSRLSGASSAVQIAAKSLGGEIMQNDQDFWQNLREHQHPFFTNTDKLWRLSIPPCTAPLSLTGETLHEWGGGLRWLKSGDDAQKIQDVVRTAGGHAALFSGGDRSQEVFQPLVGHLLKLHQNLKLAFDPHRIFNPGRMYQDI